MAIVTSEKIFIDPSEEIVTIIERILKAEKDRIILVIPQNSLLLSGYISINILFREVAKTDKTLLIVTEDSYGQHIAERAGFVVTAKVSTITSEMWDLSAENKNELLERLKNKKIENLQNINESPEVLIQNEPNDSEVAMSAKKTADELTEEVDNNQTSESNEIDIMPTEAEEIDKVKVEEGLFQSKNIEGDLMLKKYQKPRREPKMINIDGIEMLSGGDLRKFNAEQSYAKIEGQKIMETNNSVENNIVEDSNSTAQDPVRRPNRTFSDKGSFTGMDFRTKNNNGGILGSLFSNKPRRSVDEDILGRGRSSKNKLAIIASIILVSFLIIVYLVAFRFNSVDINITLKKEDVNTQANITVDPSASVVSKSDNTIPGTPLQENGVALSRTGEASGKGIRGNKSKGEIDIINTLDQDISLPKGTKVTSSETGLVYLLTKDISVGKATPTTEGGITSATRVEDVMIEAGNPGSQYDITDSATNKQFLIGGYTKSQVYGSRFSNIVGGTSEEFTSVSQENIDKVKEVVLPDLQKQAETKLNSLIPAGYTLLKETIKFEETEVKAMPGLGEESKDKTFSLTVTAKISGIAIKEDDLNSTAEGILAGDSEDGLKINSIENLRIDKVEQIEGDYILTISSKGSLSKDLDPVEIKEKAAGLSIQELRDYLDLFDEIDKYRVVFAPGIVPSFLQRVPTDFDRINLKIQ